MGVAGGHRETCSNQSLSQQRQMGEQMRRQELNPITGEPIVRGGFGSGSGADGLPPSGRKPSGCLGPNLVPTVGPLDHMTALNCKDVPNKRVDPTRNQSTSLHSGVACLAHESNEPSRAQPSRITESCFGEGFQERERRTPTPDRSGSGNGSRRSTPGEVVRSNFRPKDNLSAGCLASDKFSDHPLNLPGKAGRAGAGHGSGGACSIMQGPNGFVPIGPEGFDMSGYAQMQPAPRDRPFQRACGRNGVAAVFGG